MGDKDGKLSRVEVLMLEAHRRGLAQELAALERMLSENKVAAEEPPRFRVRSFEGENGRKGGRVKGEID